ncbi:uncharacterized protein N0V89_006811 [Didymosphaeria variabile]|uniref:Uncharacterized protein n=1 Tax=Didymosphaeria variabile TaxID=1932322 RepID=A0A9W8XJV6_9PLEO|nr:uncharacterized protein N0V89_006811 [Didymosphaeria variabile]KAJ4351468.1 hypothetical protein N0V89_006811 [Didymosphaeria variabile]
MITTAVEYKDIVAHSAVCCPDNTLGGFHYNFWETKSDYVSYIKTTDPQGHSARVSLYVPPRCVAASVCAIPPTVTLDVVFNSEIVAKKHRRQDESVDPISPVGIVTRPWDASNNVLFANEVQYSYTVFHGTYTCFEDCYNYASYSYHNTDPNSSASSVDKDLNDSTADHDPQPTKCSASPTDSGPSETSTPESPSFGTGGLGYNNTTATGLGHSTAGAPGGTGTGAPLPSMSEFPGAATMTVSSSLWQLFLFAIVAIL